MSRAQTSCCGDGLPVTARVGVPLPVLKARAAMCHVCPLAVMGGVGDRRGAVGCRLSLADGSAAGMRTGCPVGRFPDPLGVVRWLGVRWYGVPMPLRWRLWVVLRRRVALPGCGCVVVLKDAWGRVARVAHGLRRRR